MRRRPLAAVPAALLLASGLAACGGSDDDGGEESIAGLSISGAFGEEATVEVEDLDVSEAQTAEVIAGDGAEITEDSAVRYRFAVAKAADGEEVLSNFTQPDPESMTISEQPPEIADALTGTSIGSRIALAVPVADVLGEQGAPQAGLGPDDDVVFVFDLIEEAAKPLSAPEGEEVEPPGDVPTVVTEDDSATGPVTDIDFSDASNQPPKDFEVIPLVQGEGEEVKEGDTVTVNYLGTKWGEGNEPFDNSYERGEPTEFPLNPGGLIDGWVEGLEGIPVGSRVMLIVPPDLGYGAEGNPAIEVTGKDTLVFVIDVLGANL
jgi:peptidylprolyl isomerase